jgi:hypothetical protein
MKTQHKYLLVAGTLVLAAAALVVLVTRYRDAGSSYSWPSTGDNHVASASTTAERKPSAQRPEATVPAVEVTKEPDREPDPSRSGMADLPEVSVEELRQRNPALTAVLGGRKPSKYAAVDSLDELATLIREWRSLNHYHAGLNSPGTDPAEDLLESARALARIRDENWPEANWYLAQLLVDLGQIPESAQVLSALLGESEFPADEDMRVDVMFRLALMELERPRAYWTQTPSFPDRLLSLTSPGERAFDVAERLFAELRDQGGLDERSTALMNDLILAAQKWKAHAQEHPRDSLTHTPDVLNDPMLDFRTSVVLTRELYATSAYSEDRSRVLRYTEERMPEIVSSLAQLPLEERQMWSTDAAWVMYERRKPGVVKELLEPLVADGKVWENVDAYLQAQYYLANAYASLGQHGQLNAVVQRLTNEGFKPEQMEANQREFYLYLRKQSGSGG